LADAAWNFSGGSVVGVYFLGYVFVAITIWSVWKLARMMVPPREALVAALCMEGVTYYVLWQHKFDHNLILTTFWSLTTLFVYRAVRRDRASDWLLAGACAGLGFLAKYSIVFLLLPLLAWTIFDPKAIQKWRRPGPYQAIAVMLLIVAPHLISAARNGWPTLAYIGTRTKSISDLYPRLEEPALFLGIQLLQLLPALIILLFGLRLKVAGWTTERRSALVFLSAAIGGPLGLHLAMGLMRGTQLTWHWGMPFWTALGLLAIVLFPLKSALIARRGVIFSLVACNCAALACLVGRALLSPGLSAPGILNFPGRLLAQEAASRWEHSFARPIPGVAGNLWVAQNIGLYGPGRPPVFYSTDPNEPAAVYEFITHSEDERIREDGALLAWGALGPNDVIPEPFTRRFPSAISLGTIQIGPVRIGLGAVPPAAELAGGYPEDPLVQLSRTGRPLH
jgi:4-amino-4-deoxy-L-arabinose transferase-like glycosyltransferase